MNKYKNYLEDLSVLLKVKLESIYSDSGQAKSMDNENFVQGQIFALYEVLDLIKQQAAAFEIPLEELQLQSFNLERFLVKQK